MPYLSRLLPLLLCLLTLPACGGAVYAPARTAGFQLDDPREIDDDDIAKAFLARPQMEKEFRVAYYVFAEAHAGEVEAMLDAAPGVVSTYRIPSLMVTGERRFDPKRSVYDQPENEPVRLKQLRLLAARAHADVLIVVDYGYEVTEKANGWTAFGVALVPLLFVPWLDVEVESYVDSYVIDVRNGFLYGHLSTEDRGEEKGQTIYSSADETLIDAQLKQLLGETRHLIGKLVDDEHNQRKGSLADERQEPPAQSAR